VGQVLLEGDILALPSVELDGAVETLRIVVAIGCWFEVEASTGELGGSVMSTCDGEAGSSHFFSRR
jgi:hypothetical protein